MALYDIADLTQPPPSQLVLDASLLLALRQGDDNPQAEVTRLFVRWLGDQIAEQQTVAWLLTSVLQECYHVLLSRRLRQTWEAMPPTNKPPNWLAAYKQQPELLGAGFADIASLDEILRSIPLTPAQPSDLVAGHVSQSIEERVRHFITTYYLLPQDALILAEAEQLGVTAVATLDRDWRRVTEFDVYTTPC